MATDSLSSVLQRLGEATLRQGGGDLTDGQLLECFVTGRSEPAFAALVRRHGLMVFGVCRRLLRHEQDAEDAFQATFLVLARKAASVKPRELVGHWLYGVAYRTALDARSAAARRRTRERQVTDMPEPQAPAADAGPDLRPLLDRELARLPEKYRVPVVLCELEGKSRKEVARLLRLPEGTLSSRLATARKMLAGRLARRGLAVTGAALAAALAAPSAQAGVPAPLMVSTVQAATLFAAGAAATPAVSARVVALTRGVLKAMLLTRLKIATLVVLALAMLGTATGMLLLPRLDAQPAAGPPGGAGAPARGERPAAKSTVEKMTELYALPKGEVLKHVPEPFPPVRMEYYTQQFADQAKLIPSGPTVMTFRWEDGKLRNWTMTFNGPNHGTALAGLLGLAGIYPQETEGDAGLLKESITGDWVVRQDTPAAKVVPRLEEILRKDCKLPIRLTLKEVERKVLVAQGKYRLRTLPGYNEDDGIQVYGKQLVPNSGAGGGSGTFRDFLENVGAYIGRRMVGDAEETPAHLSWHYHMRGPATAEEHKEDTAPEGVLKHLGEQTGLTFKEETRKVRVLFVERTEEPAGQPKPQ
jgi:RNA polymerase sigma factor (sigma-70 family)